MKSFVYGVFYVLSVFFVNLLMCVFFVMINYKENLEFINAIVNLVDIVVGIVLLFSYFRGLKENFFIEGVAAGIIWFSMISMFDLVVLLPQTGHIRVKAWFFETGMYFLIIPVISSTLGYVIEKYR